MTNQAEKVLSDALSKHPAVKVMPIEELLVLHTTANDQLRRGEAMDLVASLAVEAEVRLRLTRFLARGHAIERQIVDGRQYTWEISGRTHLSVKAGAWGALVPLQELGA